MASAGWEDGARQRMPTLPRPQVAWTILSKMPAVLLQLQFSRMSSAGLGPCLAQRLAPRLVQG